jgi:hypothetical protein
LYVFDLAGKQVTKAKVVFAEVNLSGLPNGTYYIREESNNTPNRPNTPYKVLIIK